MHKQQNASYNGQNRQFTSTRMRLITPDEAELWECKISENRESCNIASSSREWQLLIGHKEICNNQPPNQSKAYSKNLAGRKFKSLTHAVNTKTNNIGATTWNLNFLGTIAFLSH